MTELPAEVIAEVNIYGAKLAHPEWTDLEACDHQIGVLRRIAETADTLGQAEGAREALVALHRWREKHT